MKIIVDGIATEYEDEGAGPVVLVLHGWKDDLHTFDTLVSILSNSHRVVRLDLPGFGGTDMSKNTGDISAYVAFVASFIAKLQLDVDTIIGHSFGGRIAIKGVGTGALYAKHLVLIAAAGLAKRRTWRNGVLAIVAKFGKFLTLIPPFRFWRYELRRKLYEFIGSDYFNAGALKETFVNVVSEDLSQYASKIKVPTLIIWGKGDATTRLEQAQRIHQLVRGSKLTILDDAGHFVHRERPQETADLINAFL